MPKQQGQCTVEKSKKPQIAYDGITAVYLLPDW